MRYPLTASQLAIYYESINKAGLPVYIIPVMITLDKEVDLERLRQAVDLAIAQYPVLSMVIALGDDGMPVLTESGKTVTCSIETLSNEEFELMLRQLPAPINLEGGQLFEARIFSTPDDNYLYLPFHHIVGDGATYGAVLNAIINAYKGQQLAQVPLTIFDVQAREDEIRRSPRFNEAKQWYGDTFSCIESDSLPLPDCLVVNSEEKEKARESILDTLARKVVALKVDYDKVYALSRELHVPMSIVLDGAFGYMVGVWNAAKESSFCTIFAGRKTPEDKAVAGMMVKTVPVYCRWDDDTTVADYLTALARQHKMAKDYSDAYSFAEVCSDLGFTPKMNFSYRGSIQAENTVIPGFCTGSRRLGNYTTGDTLLFMVDHIQGGLVMRSEYQGSQYTQEFIESMIDAYDMVLQGFVSCSKLSEIELCSSEMLQKLESFNTTIDSEELTETIVDAFQRHALKTPDKVADISPDGPQTYAEVDRTAKRIGAFINSRNIGPGQVVAVMVDRNQWMLPATMGVLYSGAAYEPLDPSYPAERLNYMMRDASVRLLIVDPHLPLNLDDDLKEKVEILYTDRINDLPQLNPQQKPSLEDTFILLYTSGTTGVPKGVKLTHSNLMSLAKAHAALIPDSARPESVWAMYPSYGFDAGFFMLLLPVIYGASTVIVPEDIRLDIDALNAFFCRHGVTTVFMTTQVGRIFAITVEQTSVKDLMVGGEKLVPCLPPKTFNLYNLYGPTEGTVYCHGLKVDKLYSRVPIGRTTNDYKNYIVDSLGRRMPLGALGEMLISGPQVGAGYLNLPERTEKVFINNPFSDNPLYGRAYCTGDVVRLLPQNGQADIIGRNDGQVKVRGFRIELTEVEQVVREFPSITDATVQAFDSPRGGKFIAAYIVSPQKVDIPALEAFIAERKPHYMVPEVTMQIDAIPLNRNQKVDKRALPVPQFTPDQSGEDQEKQDNRQPNLLEKTICEIVSDVLKTDNVPLTLQLSRLGLTSISSIRLASALYKRFGVTFKGAQLVKDATVVTIEDDILTELLAPKKAPQSQKTDGLNSGDQTQDNAGKNQQLDGSTSASEGTGIGNTKCALTVSQQGVYADTMRNPGTTSYNIPVYFRFAKDTDTKALADALSRILDAHPFLRDAHLTMGDEDVEQTVDPHLRPVVTIKEMSDEELEEYKKHFIKPFDLWKAPLYRLEVVSTPEAVYLLMDVQHIVFDGSSLTVMLSQLKTLLEGGEIAMEEFSYLDYAHDENQWLEGEGGAKAKAFFKEMLSECESASDIPSDMPKSSDAGERGITTEAVDMDRIQAFCRDNSLTPAALLLAATCYATARFTSSRSAFISTISTGRGDVRFGETLGMFVKTLPIGLTIGEETALQYALKAKETLAQTIENEMYPYARICADYNYSPNIVYEYQYGLVDDYTINGNRVQRHLFDVDTLKFRIAVHIEEVDGQLSVAVHFRKGIYSETLMRTFCQSIAQVAKEIIAAPNQAIRKLSMLTSEQRVAVDTLASTQITPHSQMTFHALMEQQARLKPDHTAIIASDGTLTYSELDRMANLVANNLIAKGVKKGDKVVLLLSRTSRFFTSLYGVLKAGAAYIPSSPDYPQERKQSIIEDSQAAYVITDDNVDELHQGDNFQKPEVEISPDDLVYLIYTSGSTGKPKGVLLRHKGIVNYVTPAESVIHTQAIVNRSKVVGSITTVAFDMALKEWGIALSNGLTLVFAADEHTNDPVALAQEFTKHHVDYFNTTPSRMQQYMELEEFCSMLSGCKVVICGAEKYPENLLQKLRQVAPEAEIFNTYGPTEITVSSNAACLTSKDKGVSVGRPLRNYVEHIVDADDNLLPQGVIGELLIGGDNIALGYNANPEQTSKAFIEFMGLPTYRSGDYARWDKDGNVVILGRKDTQVKLRGLRIELGEIERVIGEIDGVASSHIMIRNVAGRENLVAYYALKAGSTLTPSDIRDQMAKKLTDYMLPSFYVEMPSMPLTPNGKINTRALPEPEVASREAGREAANDLERFFIEIYKKILETDTVYADDSFFALGGTSLTATRIMIAASKAGHRIVYADIFANPTPEGLAKLVATSEDATSSTKAQTASTGENSQTTAATQATESTKTAQSKEVKDKEEKNKDTKDQKACKCGSDNTNVLVGHDGYDYRAIDALLRRNTLDSFRSGIRRQLGTVMLTGATGFAGMHVLRELLTNYQCKIVCLGRDSRRGVSAQERIEQLYFYYFGESLSERFPDRVVVVKGDITKLDKDFDAGIKIDTVINCAANVKHFSAGTDIEDINYYGVLNLIEWCRVHNASLVQTSTVSVTGRQPSDRDTVLNEQSLYIGQDFGGNKYIISKFMAERAVLQAHADGKIVGKVVRLGNLAPRERDGEFQINFTTNGFMNRLKSIVLVGCYPYAMYSQNKDISPIDDVAKAIVLFAQTPDDCTVFHGNNANRYSLGNFYYEASKAGLDIHPVETEEFAAALDEAKNDPEKLGALVGLMAYEGMGSGLVPVDYSNTYSAQVLLRMNFHWPVISSDYVYKLVRQLEGLGFFL